MRLVNHACGSRADAIEWSPRAASGGEAASGVLTVEGAVETARAATVDSLSTWRALDGRIASIWRLRLELDTARFDEFPTTIYLHKPLLTPSCFGDLRPRARRATRVGGSGSLSASQNR